MAKKNTDYTPEQIKEIQDYFKKNDFTSYMTLDANRGRNVASPEIYAKAKRFISEYWLANLPELGVKRMMKNYTHSHPVKLLQKRDSEHFAKQVSDIAEDGAQLDAVPDRYLEMFRKPLTAGIEAYAKSVGKEADDLTDEEISFIIDKCTDAINEELIKVVMLGQQVPEMFGVSSKNAAHEDFNGSVGGNLDLINFHNKWTHCKTKLGAPLFFGDLSEEEATGIEGAKSFFASADEQTQKEYEELRDSFANTLSSTDREIYYLSEQGYTHAEIASRLGYKSPSSVTKRLQSMRKKYDEFCGYVEAKQKKKQ
ncbi:MAG: sigma-70 region 4 domain-containing protein [Clostridia bacterium]|nr:sigma-70 region 4 domain-containing protein [Clostridia bacterium]